MDEPTSALDPISTLKIEDLMDELKSKYTVAIVTHNMQQATRIADYTAFFLVGEVVEYAAIPGQRIISPDGLDDLFLIYVNLISERIYLK